MRRINKQLLDGNVETLILAVLQAGPSYGYAIAKELNARSEGILALGEGTLYPVLHRLEEEGLLASKWRLADNGRRRKYYRLNPKGRRALAVNREQWDTLAAVMRRVLHSDGRSCSEPLFEGATP
jgi:transcriptional regulator